MTIMLSSPVENHTVQILKTILSTHRAHLLLPLKIPKKIKGLSNEISIASGGSYSHTPVQFPSFRNNFPLEGHSQMPRSQDSQSSSLCFPYLSCSFIFTNGINSFPFPLVTNALSQRQDMNSRGWRLNCGWSLSQAPCAASGGRKEGRMKRKKQWFLIYQWPLPEGEKGNVDKMLLFRNTPVKSWSWWEPCLNASKFG